MASLPEPGRQRPAHRRSFAFLCALATVLAGCGSTVRQVPSATVAGSPSGLGAVGAGELAAAEAGLGGAVDSAPGATASGRRPGGTGPGAGAGTQAGAAAGSGTAPNGTPTTGSRGAPAGGLPGTSSGGPAGPAGGVQQTSPTAADNSTGRGFDATTINLGVGIADDEESTAALTAIGANIDELTVDYDAALRAVVDDINADGGIGGRQINLVVHDLNVAEVLFSPSTAAQAACATWTEDAEVFAVVLHGLAFIDDLISCLHDADTPVFGTSGSEGDGRSYQAFYDRFPLFYNIGAVEGARYDRVAMRRLVERDFFQPWDTIRGAPASGPTTSPMRLGMVVRQGERGDRTLESQTAELASYGIEVTSVFRSSGRIENAAADAQSAMLRFRADGITHVFGSGLFHHTVAEEQGYRPRYFFSQEVLDTIAMSSPPEQLRGSMASSAIPAAATNSSSYPGHPQAYLPCLAALQAAGVNPSTNNDHWTMQSLCDAFYPLREAIAASGVLSNDGLRAGFTALGDRPVSSVTWTSQFTDTQHANVVGLRDISFREDCTCFAYDSDVDHTG